MAFKMKGSPYAKGTHKTKATMAYFKGSALKQKSEKFKEAMKNIKTGVVEPGPKLPTEGNIDIPKKALTKKALTGAVTGASGVSQLIMPDVNLMKKITGKKTSDAFKQSIKESTTEGVKQSLMDKGKEMNKEKLKMSKKKGLIDKKDISKTYSDAGEPGALRPKSGTKKLGSPAKNYKNPRDYKVFNMGNEAAPPFKQYKEDPKLKATMKRVGKDLQKESQKEEFAIGRKASSTFSSKPKKRLFGGTKTVTTTTDDTGAKTKTKTVKTKKGDMKKRKTISATETIKEKFGRKGSLRAHLEGATDRELTKGKIRVTHGEGKGAKHKVGSIIDKRNRKKLEREADKQVRKTEGSKLRQKFRKKKNKKKGEKFFKEMMPATHELMYKYKK